MLFEQALNELGTAAANVQGVPQRLGSPVRRPLPKFARTLDLYRGQKKKKEKKEKSKELDPWEYVVGSAKLDNIKKYKIKEGQSVGRDKYADPKGGGDEEHLPGVRSFAKTKPLEISGKERRKKKRKVTLYYGDYQFGIVGMANKYV